MNSLVLNAIEKALGAGLAVDAAPRQLSEGTALNIRFHCPIIRTVYAVWDEQYGVSDLSETDDVFVWGHVDPTALEGNAANWNSFVDAVDALR